MNNENEFTYEGIKYRANKSGGTSCSTCALFPEPMNCALIVRPSCNGAKRRDGQHINFEVMQ